MTWGVPTIGGIQRMTFAVAAATTLALLTLVSGAAAVGCVIGAALMIVNLYVLSFLGRMVLAMAQASGGPTGLGVVAAPLKMFLLIGVVYLVVSSGRVNVPGFIVGILTQFAAIFIETGRVSIGTWRLAARDASVRSEDQQA